MAAGGTLEPCHNPAEYPARAGRVRVRPVFVHLESRQDGGPIGGGVAAGPG